MAKFSTFCFFLALLVLYGDVILVVPIAEAKDCHKVWNCKGDNRCWEDCKNHYNGKGLCDLYTAPSVPKQCFCAYKC
ncbi:hypothetical protein Dsin_023947 [Dipteronia sinensis]|uniref:Uncharacterized protein n=1 Tax=Dipteronia sinensis TaxID=43782 RepID=A0AAE0E2L0_9ROSI|nr:hypothetical protein Dsin_023947 [Dipteronia sinensis]